MKEFRLGRNTTAHYTSFEDMGKAYNCKPKTKNEDKMKELQSKFIAKHKCKACDQPLTYIGGSVMTCTNEKCKGIKIEREDYEGNKIVSYVTSYELLKDNDSSYANYIFS
jgi:hypothetical protein